MTKTVLILGASGKIGSHCATTFWNAGWKVKSFDRQRDDMTKAAIGVDVIVNGLNPPNYHNWAEIIPAITQQVIKAAKESGATVVIPGNVYNFGNTPGTWSEKTPQVPVSRKGQIRVEMERAYRDSGVQTIVLRAGNFIDPDQSDDVMSVLIMRSIKKGKISHAGAPDVMQAYCYLPDWALAAQQLADKRADLGEFEDIPFPGHSFTTLDLKSVLETETGRSLKLTAFPWIVMNLLAPFWELAREMKEMRYLWETPHTLSGEKFQRLLPNFQHTNLATVMAAGLPSEVYPNHGMARRNGSASA